MIWVRYTLQRSNAFLFLIILTLFQEYGVSDPDEVLATMVVNLLDEFQGSYLYVHLETLGQEADQWQPCRRRDGRPATPFVQVGGTLFHLERLQLDSW